MFGIAAIHKFASWDKVDLLILLLPFLTDEEINAVGGINTNKGSCLHFAVEMNAVNAIKFLMQSTRLDLSIIDKNGFTACDLAAVNKINIDDLCHAR